jgi:hypothetical protein
LAVPPRQAEVIAFAALSRNLIEINDGGAVQQLRQLGDIRRDPPRLIL